MRWPDVSLGGARKYHMCTMLEMQRPFSLTGAGPLVQSAGDVQPGVGVAIYVPFELERTARFTTAWIFNGGSGGGNWDLGVYDAVGNRRWSSGGFAFSGANVPQTQTISGGLTLSRGCWYFALGCQNNNHCFAFNGAATSDHFQVGLQRQTSAYPLPNPATFGTNFVAQVPFGGLVGQLL
jgi:hypothetical protein